MGRDRASRPEAKPIRLFVAVDVPGSVKDKLSGDIAPIRERLAVARWTRQDGWHVTLKFLGSTWPRLVGEVEAAVRAAAIDATAFDSALTALGVFPSTRRARVVWVGLADPDRRLASVARDLDERLADHFVPENRDLTPHLTLARLAPSRNLDEFAPGLAGTPVPSAPFRIEELVLYRSHLSPAGARYEPLLTAPFGR